MRNNEPFSFKNRIQSIMNAVRGISATIREEHNMRIHLVVAAGVIALGFSLNITTFEWLVITLTIVLVFAAELINTSLEHLADAVSDQEDSRIGRSKDIAAGAVLLLAMAAIVVGLIIFGPRLIALF